MKTGVLHAGVTEVVEKLDAVNPQHHRQRVGLAAASRLGIDRLGIAGPDAVFQSLSGNQAIHALQEDLPAGPALLALVSQVSKGGLFYLRLSLRRYLIFQPQYAMTCRSCSECP